MNNVYFGCTACHIFVDAGYRHAHWTLERTGVVSRTAPVDVSAVINASEYWEVDTDWLVGLLSAVRVFLETHREHRILFGDRGELELTPMYDGDYRLFDWLMDEGGFAYEELPRYYAERLGFRLWEQVVEHINTCNDPPWWWDDEKYRHAANQKFLTLVTDQKSKDADGAT